MNAVIRRTMEICPHCGALESARIYATKKDFLGNLIRYRKCKLCKKVMASELLLRPENASQ